MNKYCVIPEEVRFDIEMKLYIEYNDRLANMYDHLEYYSLKDIKDLEELEKYDRKWMISDYLEGKKVYTKEELDKIHNYLYGGK